MLARPVLRARARPDEAQGTGFARLPWTSQWRALALLQERAGQHQHGCWGCPTQAPQAGVHQAGSRCPQQHGASVPHTGTLPVSPPHTYPRPRGSQTLPRHLSQPTSCEEPVGPGTKVQGQAGVGRRRGEVSSLCSACPRPSLVRSQPARDQPRTWPPALLPGHRHSLTAPTPWAPLLCRAAASWAGEGKVHQVKEVRILFPCNQVRK